MKRIRLLVCAAIAAFCCTFMLQLTAYATAEDKGIVILHTNDIHCGINATDDRFGYADLAAYRAKLEGEGYETLLVDAGDAIQGDLIGMVSDGAFPVQIMNRLGYNIAVPGNHEFDYGMENFFKLKGEAKFPYLSANFMDLTTKERVLDGYTILEADGVKLGFVGICAPGTITSSTPTIFKNKSGEYIYDFCSKDDGSQLYSVVQEAVDSALAEGADYIIAVGHLGIGSADSPWSSQAVISKVGGIDVFIDGHSHSVIDGEVVVDKDGENVLLVSTGAKLANIGTGTISQNGISTKLVSKSDFTVSEDTSSPEYAAYAEADSFIKGIEAEYAELANRVVAKTEVDFVKNKPMADTGKFRPTETNLGDFCADAYRTVLGADFAFINDGGIRAELAKGDIRYSDIVSVLPFQNMLCLVEASGQQILDALELGAVTLPEGSGSFLQVSGLTYEVQTSIPPSVVLTENKEFVRVDGEYRVKNVMVGGEPLDLDKIYTVAGQDYMLKKGGGGFTMFSGCNILMDQVILDTQAVINYITDNLNGCIGSEYADPSGQGRIVILTSEDAAAPTTQTQSAETTETSESTESTETTEVTEITNSTNSTNSTVWILVAVAVCAVAVIVILKKKR